MAWYEIAYAEPTILGTMGAGTCHMLLFLTVTSWEFGLAKHLDAWVSKRYTRLYNDVIRKNYEAKDDLESLDKAISDAYEVDALIQSQFHKTYALLWKKLERPQEFFKSSIMYLAFTPLSAIKEKDRPALAFDIGVAALIAEEEFIFGELLQQELLQSLDGSEYEWIKDFLKAFGEGRFDMYDAALAKHHRGKPSDLKVAKARFQKMMGIAAKKAAAAERILSAKIAWLTGVEHTEQVKSYQGRELLRLQREANHADIMMVVTDGIRSGQRRGFAILKQSKKHKGAKLGA